MKTKPQCLIRLAEFTIEEIFLWMKNIPGKNLPKGRAWLYGESVKYNSKRLRTFLHKGIYCTYCGKKSTHFALEKHEFSLPPNGLVWHLNLYIRGLDGSETLMTADHLVPKSKNGGNGQSNLVPACTVCNLYKGSRMPIGKWLPRYLKEEERKRLCHKIQFSDYVKL